MLTYDGAEPLVPPLLAAEGRSDGRGGRLFGRHWYRAGQLDVRPLPRPRPTGGDCFAFWPDDVPVPPALETRPPLATLMAVEFRLQPPQVAEDDRLLVLLPDGTPHICTRATLPERGAWLGVVTTSVWSD